MIDTEYIQKRRAELQAQREQLAANLQAISGAIALCDELLSEIAPSAPSAPSCKNSDA